MLPLRVDTAERFVALRDLLTRAHYHGEQICARLGVATLYDYRPSRNGRAAPPADALDVLIRLFLDEASLDGEVVHSLLPADDIDTLLASGLLTSSQADDESYRSSVLFYPSDSLYIASDRTLTADAQSPASDLVYPAISDSTRRFLTLLPSSPCESFLELCAGTGIAALRAARNAGHAWATDISERATHFARFNALLNGVDNFTAVSGDLFQAVPGQTFDRICAHPPYMPAVEQALICHDGGEDGEQITRRVVAGLPTCLREGGRFYCYCLITDREGLRAEERVRGMLGDAGGEFDIAVVVLDGFRPEEYYALLLKSGSVTTSGAQGHLEALKRLQVRQLVFCWVVIQRPRKPRGGFSVRRRAGKETGHRHVDWLLRRETAALERGSAEWLLEAKPTRAPGVRLSVDHGLGAEGWTPTGRTLQTDIPFPLTAKCSPWAAELVAACDGETTVREHFEALRRSGVIGEETPQDVLLSSVGVLLAGGFIHVEGLEPPAEDTEES